MSRVERLLNLTSALLHTRRPLRSDEIHDTIPGYPDDKASFRRQFERDKDALRQLGLPLTTEVIDSSIDEAQVGYRIRPDHYFLRDPGLTPDELSAIHLAAQAVRYGDDPTVSGLWKLGLVGPDGSADRSAVEAAAALPSAAPLALLFESIATRTPITFGYRGESRTVAARRLTFRNGHWYLSAFDPARNDDRSFRVDRIEEPVALSDASFTVPDEGADRTSRESRPFDAPWELGDGAAVEALVLVDPPHATWAEARLGATAVVETRESDAKVFRFSVRSPEAFRSFVLGFLHHAEILSPMELRNDVISWVRTGAEAVPNGVL